MSRPLPQNDLRLVRNGKNRGVEVVGVAFKYVEEDSQYIDEALQYVGEDQALLGLCQGSRSGLGACAKKVGRLFRQ